MKIWPTRTKHVDTEPVTDLDAIIAEPVSFRYKGKIHTLRPMRLDEFLKFTNAQANLMGSLKDTANPMTAKALAKKYHEVVFSVCETITIDDILGMEQVQVAALYQLVIDLVTGQVKTGDDSKKKRQKIPLYESVQPLSSPSAPESLVGQPPKH